jgi:catechol 2,3-dioxygenase-like lactoylglutathione lyase family enzyme
MGLMLDHLSIQCADMTASAAFYDAVLGTLGGQRIMDFGDAIGYGVPPRPDFWGGRSRGYPAAGRRNSAVSRNGTPNSGESGGCFRIGRSSTSARSEKIHRSSSGE